MFDTEEGKSKEQEPLKIEVGDVFEDTAGEKNHLVGQLGDNYFNSIDIYKTKDGKEALTVGGSTVTRQFVHQVVDHWEPDRVLLALKAGIADFYSSNFSQLWSTKKILDAIKTEQEKAIRRLSEELQKPPITLK